MYAPIGTKQNQTLSDAAAAELELPAGVQVGDKQLIYLLADNTTGSNVALTAKGASFESGFVVVDKDVVMLGPILGADLDKWGAFCSAGAVSGFTVSFIAGDVRVDTGTATSPFGSTPAIELQYKVIYTTP